MPAGCDGPAIASPIHHCSAPTPSSPPALSAASAGLLLGMVGGSTRVSAPPEWAALPPDDAGSSIDPIYMIQQIGVLNEANRPAAAASQQEEDGGGGGSDDDDADVESQPTVAAAKRLWDLAAGEARAAFLVQHRLHDVALLILARHERHPPRLCELCMGCLANLASVPEVAPTLAEGDELVTAVLRVWMTCADALVLSETARLHLAFSSCAATSGLWRQHLTADEPLNQLVCLAMTAKEPLLLARLCAVLQQVLRDMPVAYHLVGKCHFATILSHLLETEVPPSLSLQAGGSSISSISSSSSRPAAAGRGTKRQFEEDTHGAATVDGDDDDDDEGGGLREGALSQTPWSRGTGRAFGAQTATLADQAVDSGGLQSALFFQLHAAEVLAYYSQEAMLPPDGSQATAADEEAASVGVGVRCCPAQALAQQVGLPRVLMTVVRRTKGKGGLGRAGLATLDYLLELPEQKGGWRLQNLPGAAPAFAALSVGMAAAVAAIQASKEGGGGGGSGDGGGARGTSSSLLAPGTEEELSEFREMLSIGWTVMAKVVVLELSPASAPADAASMPKAETGSRGQPRSQAATMSDAGDGGGSGARELYRLACSDQLTTVLVDVVKAGLVQRDEAVPTLRHLLERRGGTAAAAAGDNVDEHEDTAGKVTKQLQATLASIDSTDVPPKDRPDPC